ncbi:MAG: peptide deformylase [Pseudomonadota bacterium]
MALLPLIEYPDKRLRQQSRTVEKFDASLQRALDNLVETFYASGGIGLSAPQAGDFRRILIMDLSDDRSSAEIFINPEIVGRERPALVEESCLSVPGVIGNVVRDTRVTVRASDSEGRVFERDLEDMEAVCLQHELDHLEGRLFIDRLPIHRRLSIGLGTFIRNRRKSASQHVKVA